MTFSRRSSNGNIKSLVDGLNTETIPNTTIEFKQLGLLEVDEDNPEHEDYFNSINPNVYEVIQLKGKNKLPPS